MITAKYEGKKVHVVKLEYEFRNDETFVAFNFVPKKYRTPMPDMLTVLSDLTEINFNNTKD